MWRIFHKLFGWHYVYMESSAGILKMVRRVRISPAGERYVHDYAGDGFLFIDRPGLGATRFYDINWIITPLTWINPIPADPSEDAKLRVVK